MAPLFLKSHQQKAERRPSRNVGRWVCGREGETPNCRPVGGLWSLIKVHLLAYFCLLRGPSHVFLRGGGTCRESWPPRRPSLAFPQTLAVIPGPSGLRPARSTLGSPQRGRPGTGPGFRMCVAGVWWGIGAGSTSGSQGWAGPVGAGLCAPGEAPTDPAPGRHGNPCARAARLKLVPGQPRAASPGRSLAGTRQLRREGASGGAGP